jgi:hypothetical protein
MEFLQFIKTAKLLQLIKTAKLLQFANCICKTAKFMQIAIYKNEHIIAILQIIKIPSIGFFLQFIKTTKLWQFCKLQFIKTAKLLQFANCNFKKRPN